MALREAEPLIEALRVKARMMRQQLDQLAAPCACFADRPLHELLADAATGAVGGPAHIPDKSPPGAFRTQAGQDAGLEAASHPARLVLGDDQREATVALDLLERGKIAIRQRLL